MAFLIDIIHIPRFFTPRAFAFIKVTSIFGGVELFPKNLILF